MSHVVVVPGASSKKLPFVHDNFKPSSKFAKSFGGYNRFSRVKPSSNGHEDDNLNHKISEKLPRIMFNGFDKRKLKTFGSVRRGDRKEYPGFAGQSRVLRHKTIIRNNELSKSQSLDTLLQTSSSNSHPEIVPAESKNKKKKHLQTLASLDDTNIETAVGQMNLEPNSSHVQFSPRSEKGYHKTSDQLQDQGIDLFFDGEDSIIRDLANNNHNRNKELATNALPESPFTDEILSELDPYARDFDERLRELRGMSGVKRERAKKAKLGNVRPLGDLMTSRRIKELNALRNILDPEKL